MYLLGGFRVKRIQCSLATSRFMFRGFSASRFFYSSKNKNKIKSCRQPHCGKARCTHGVRSGSPGLDVFIFYIYIARNLQGFNDRVSAGLLSDARRRFEEIILHLCRRASCNKMRPLLVLVLVVLASLVQDIYLYAHTVF